MRRVAKHVDLAGLAWGRPGDGAGWVGSPSVLASEAAGSGRSKCSDFYCCQIALSRFARNILCFADSLESAYRPENHILFSNVLNCKCDRTSTCSCWLRCLEPFVSPARSSSKPGAFIFSPRPWLASRWANWHPLGASRPRGPAALAGCGVAAVLQEGASCLPSLKPASPAYAGRRAEGGLRGGGFRQHLLLQ